MRCHDRMIETYDTLLRPALRIRIPPCCCFIFGGLDFSNQGKEIWNAKKQSFLKPNVHSVYVWFCKEV